METYPDEWERFLADPYAHRAPRAESYHDLSGKSFLPHLISTGPQTDDSPPGTDHFRVGTSTRGHVGHWSCFSHSLSGMLPPFCPLVNQEKNADDSSRTSLDSLLMKSLLSKLLEEI